MILRALVFGLAALYFAAFRHYGFQLEDEGTLLSHLARAAAGDRPYLDFFTVYTPGFYALGAAALAGSGTDVPTLRVLLALLHAATASGLYELALPLSGPVAALLVPLAWVVLLPVHVGEFASFNVPYPAWIAGALWVGLALVLRTWARRGTLAWLACAGMVAALTASIKINAGAHQLVAAAIVVAATTRRGDGTTPWPSRVILALAALGVVTTMGAAIGWLDAVVLLMPMVLLTLVALRRPRGVSSSTPRRADHAWVALLGGFAAGAAFWTVPWLVRLGPAAFGKSILLFGTTTLDLYRVAYPAPDLFAAIVLAAVASFGVVAAVRRRHTAPPVWTRDLALLGLAIGALLVATLVVYARDPVLPEGVPWTLRIWLEAALPWLIPAAHVGAVVALMRAGDRVPEPRRYDLLCLTAAAIAMYWQVFPRSDAMHVTLAMPLSLVLVVAGLARVPAVPDRIRPVRAVVCLGVGVLVAAVVATPGLRAALSCDAPVDGASRLALCVEPSASDDLTDLRAAASYVRASTEPGARLLAFPALGGLLFAAERASAMRHDYWFPGAPDHADERAMVGTLKRDPPPVVVALNEQLWVFEGAPRYFATLRAFVRHHYRLAARFGRYDVFARRDRALAAPPSPPSRSGSLVDVASPVAAYRRQAIRRWLARDSGLDASVPPWPTDRRDTLRLLRAVRDGGDARAVGWILAGLASADARVRAEAAASGGELARRMETARWRWAADVPSARLQETLARHRDDAERLTHADSAALRSLGEAILAYLRAAPWTDGSTSFTKRNR